jgi:Leucine-rich repeat (LRR) protein
MLSLRNKGLTALPQQIPDSATGLDVSANFLSSAWPLPSHIQHLSFAANLLSQLDIPDLAVLESLDLSHNLIQNLAVYLLFSLYLFRSSVSHFEVEVRIDLSVGADQQR